jgi:hypothetical protein
MTLSWDGIRADIPAGMEPVVLDKGFVRLAGSGLPVLDLRFAPEKAPFHPVRDGRRLLKAAGLQGPLRPFDPPWSGRVRGPVWSEAERGGRLFAVHFPRARGVAAALFASPPPEEILRSLLRSLDWTPPEAWRTWSCFDLAFETPPGAALTRASFKPGAFHLEFALRGSRLILDRLAPAGVILGDRDLADWLEGFARREHDPEARVVPEGPDRARFHVPEPAWRRHLAWLPRVKAALRGHGRLETAGNRILVVSEKGRLMPQPDFERIVRAYAAPPVTN